MSVLERFAALELNVRQAVRNNINSSVNVGEFFGVIWRWFYKIDFQRQGDLEAGIILMFCIIYNDCSQGACKGRGIPKTHRGG